MKTTLALALLSSTLFAVLMFLAGDQRIRRSVVQSCIRKSFQEYWQGLDDKEKDLVRKKIQESKMLHSNDTCAVHQSQTSSNSRTVARVILFLVLISCLVFILLGPAMDLSAVAMECLIAMIVSFAVYVSFLLLVFATQKFITPCDFHKLIVH